MPTLSKTIFLLLALLLFSLQQAHAQPNVIATIKPIHSLLNAVMGETNPPLLDNNISPHLFHLKPSHIRILSSAQIVFYVDDCFESFLAPALKSLPSSVKKIRLTADKSLALLHNRSKAKKHTHIHGACNDDMHIWLSPHNAIRIATFMAKVLSQYDSANAPRYQGNANKLIQRIQQLDQTLARRFAPIKNKPFMVFHDAYQYLEHRYQLKMIDVIRTNPESPISPQHLISLRKKIGKGNIACIFSEPQFPSRLIESIRAGSNISIATLDPLGADLPAGKDLYFDLLNDLSNTMVACLQSSSKT